MRKGTKSLLFGVHLWWWHPLTVYIAWWKLKGCFPGWREMVCAFVHDWGYWGCVDMDSGRGDAHPELGANIAGRLFGKKYHDLCLYHSRHYAKRYNAKPSELCWADKLSISYEHWWYYLPRAMLSGELEEYREICSRAGFVPLEKSNKIWFDFVQDRFLNAVRNRDCAVIVGLALVTIITLWISFNF